MFPLFEKNKVSLAAPPLCCLRPFTVKITKLFVRYYHFENKNESMIGPKIENSTNFIFCLFKANCQPRRYFPTRYKVNSGCVGFVLKGTFRNTLFPISALMTVRPGATTLVWGYTDTC